MIFAIVLLYLTPVFFFAGLLIAIFSKETRKLGLILMLVSIVTAVIGFSICSRMFMHHGPGPEMDEEEQIDTDFFVLEYAPTSDTTFCLPEMTIPTDDLMGHIYFGPSKKMLHYANTLGEWDSLRIETGIYLQFEDSISAYFKEQWIIPYTSLEIHSTEKLDYDNAIVRKMDTTHRFVLIRNKKCEEHPYYSIHNEQDYVGLVYRYIESYEEISLEIEKLIKAWDLHEQSKKHSDTLRLNN